MRREFLGLSTGSRLSYRRSSLAVLLVLAAFVLPALRPGPDADVFWHLRAGDDLLAGRPGTFSESWSYSIPGRIWVNHEWLSEVFFALARRAAGEPGLLLFTALVTGLTGLILWRTARRRGVPVQVAAFLLAAAAAAISDRLVPRPQIFTYLCLALLFERLAAIEKGASPWVLVPLQILWTNLHGPLWGLFFALPLLAGGAVPSLTVRRRIILCAALGLASLVHAQGPRVITDYVGFIFQEGLYRQTITEYLPLLSPNQPTLPQRVPILLLMGLAAITFLAAIPVRAARRRWGVLLCLLAVALGPFSSIRNRDLLAIAILPLFADLRAASSPGKRTSSRWLSIAAGLGALFMVAIPAAGLAFPWPGHRTPGERYHPLLPPSLALSTTGFPVQAVDFLHRHAVGTRIFNSYDFGGFLVDRLPDRKIFIDGRYVVFGEDTYRTYLETRDGGPEAVTELDRTKTDLLLIRYPQPDGYQALADRVLVRPEWALVFWDDETLLFARRSGAPAVWIAAHEYRRLIPTVPGMMQSPDYWRLYFHDLVLEASHAAVEAPLALLPRVLLGLTFEYNGRDGDAARAFRGALALKPDHGPALLGLKRIGERHPEGLPDPTPVDAFKEEFGIAP